MSNFMLQIKASIYQLPFGFWALVMGQQKMLTNPPFHIATNSLSMEIKFSYHFGDKSPFHTAINSLSSEIQIPYHFGDKSPFRVAT